MMLALGMFVFMRQTLPYNSMKRTMDFRWPSNSRVGRRNAFQYIGVDQETLILDGDFYPELTGGRLSMLVLEIMANSGRSWPLISGNGFIYGMYVITNMTETDSEFFSDGTPRKTSFTLSLKRVDESLIALFGDITEQAETLIGKASEMGTKLSTMAGIG